MSKLDTLLAMVDSLSTKSDRIVSSICESNDLIGLILEVNGSIAAADSEIDTMTELINKNNICLNEFEKLHEKSFFLDSNLHLNQLYTNETSLSNLNKEYSYLLTSFGHQNVRHLSDQPLTEAPLVVEDKKLKNALSISNLELKPIRCRNAKVTKQKSRYRLSAAYTLNPLQENPNRDFLRSSHETNFSSIMENKTIDSSDTSIGEDTSKIHHETFIDHEDFNNLEDTFENQTSPKIQERLFTFGAMSPVNMNYVNLDDLEEYDFNLSDVSPSSSEELENFHKYLRQSRVDLRTAFPAPLQKSRSHDSVFSGVKIPTQQPPPPKFHNPAIMLTSHAKETINQPTVETIYSSSSKSNMAMDILPAMSHFKEHSKRLLQEVQPPTQPVDIPESPTKLKPLTPRRKSTFTIFNLLNSPMGSPSGFNKHSTEPAERAPPRRGSIDLMSKSFASGLMSLVAKSVDTTERGKMAEKTTKSVHFSPPEKIKKLKKGIRDPIEIRNDIQSKRLPPPDRNLQNGSHSSLTIGPGNTKVLNHGEFSIFKRPTVRTMNQSKLREALNESLFN